MVIPANLLEGKKILLGVTGSIAAYKALELLRLYIKAGAEVRVVMTPAAKKFVTPLSFEALSRNRVLDDTNESWADDFNHIKTSQWADVMVIAPATANTIAKLANGIADTILTQCALAFSGIKLIAPSANTNMIQNPMIQASIKMLAIANYEVVSTQTKELACQVVGEGAMAEPHDIFFETARIVLKDPFWEDRRVVITGGGTREKIDEVRYISNFSSGKMAKAIALSLYLKGADVCYITTKGNVGLPKSIYTIDVDDAKEMLEYTQDALRVAKKGKMSKASLNTTEAIKLIQKRPFLFMVAAVADFTPKFPQQGKLKKSMLGENWQIELQQTSDILSTLSKDREGVTTIAFKAEMDSEEGLNNARALLTQKEVDAVCYNFLDDAKSFGGEENSIIFISKEKEIDLGRHSKFDLAEKILQQAESL
ncbi:MAG: bifunctional phosphopantothenoylcysteine decarboxylase/phosphopantothenate--cysteine ligase CoaBC [Sulfuricurvum sp.]|jgi:phosphopantothenoylcysteine decarboxylase/phosphopantothenate--cysteine ligase|uniref:bifunctional phosphopantothenoylcysteine decarboxylase/phosphopantothenate--cysteine ligase CoaBC n=1 Tax=Sulfuricurvum sp. TaxID=2025608 RepID=UPI0025FCFED6|nr:bifunctional phosphopantothenoylcysteine decarboxylase/phosphopantothenate--cysteine ligase CoaBC [Sulfuricurvum sp.]MCK9372690.1 bifunctional phosphopantothenoylcysteine decarboxylase/phosphopantothenate--cysteine ligase CoaBC [Sulfuricurvum sp.]